MIVSSADDDVCLVVFLRKSGDVLSVIKKDVYPGSDVQVIVKSFQFAALVR
tara:strand:+ start:183 stop:335 length:153 start_codon:yes stop_codon:yes gene_type:complete